MTALHSSLTTVAVLLNGVDVKDLQQDSLRAALAVVPQVRLFLPQGSRLS
jgi:ABC-type multidrug transport system fused ATPase/permease subunit